MRPKSPDFWNLDLTRLTWSGWLLIVAAITAVIAVTVGAIMLLEGLGLRHGPVNNRNNRWLGIVVLAPGIAAGAGVFALGRSLFNRLGWPILRSGRKRHP
jgi:hypothetical protein